MRRLRLLVLTPVIWLAACGSGGGSGNSGSGSGTSGGGSGTAGGSSFQAVNVTGMWQMLMTSTENTGDFLIFEANFARNRMSASFLLSPIQSSYRQ